MLSGLIALCSRAAAAPPLDGVLEIDPGCRDDLAGDGLADEPSRDPSDVGATLAEELVERTSGLLDAATERDLVTSRQPSRWGHLDVVVVWRRTEHTDRPTAGELWLVAMWRR